MPAQSPMWEIAIAILVPLLVMSAALLMERVERHTIGRSARPRHGSPMIAGIVTEAVNVQLKSRFR